MAVPVDYPIALDDLTIPFIPDTFLWVMSMKRESISLGACVAILCLLVLPSGGMGQQDHWRKADEGLHWAEFGGGGKSERPDSGITVVKIDPRFYELRLLSASEHGKVRSTVKEWCRKQNLIAGINAGMYQQDGLTNVGYMRNFSHVNHSRLNRTYKAVLAFNRTDSSVPEVQIIDLTCQNFELLKNKYQSFIQNIRMVGCRQENVWTRQDRAWSIAALGMDRSGNALFIFSEPAYPVHDFINILLSLPIAIQSAMYLEGGPEASLFFSAGGASFERIGMHDSHVEDDRSRASARPVPNILGITKRLQSR
jgi:hypothetical protein